MPENKVQPCDDDTSEGVPVEHIGEPVDPAEEEGSDG